jgi:hypothetical protein
VANLPPVYLTLAANLPPVWLMLVVHLDEYLREYLKKFDITIMLFLGACGENLKQKIS